MPTPSVADLVREFHLAADQPIAAEPTAGTPELRTLRLRLIREEVEEVRVAITQDHGPAAILIELCDVIYVVHGTAISLGCGPLADLTPTIPVLHMLDVDPTILAAEMGPELLARLAALAEVVGRSLHAPALLRPVLEEMVDTVVLLAKILDLPLREGIEEVHASNMTKRHPDGTMQRDAGGKVIKPAWYRKPDLAAVIDTYRRGAVA